MVNDVDPRITNFLALLVRMHGATGDWKLMGSPFFVDTCLLQPIRYPLHEMQLQFVLSNALQLVVSMWNLTEADLDVVLLHLPLTSMSLLAFLLVGGQDPFRRAWVRHPYYCTWAVHLSWCWCLGSSHTLMVVHLFVFQRHLW